MGKGKTKNVLGCLGVGIAITGILMIMGLMTYIAFEANWKLGVIVAATFLMFVGGFVCSMVSDCSMGDNCRDEWN